MRRLTLLTIILLLVALPMLESRAVDAQDNARERVLSAYRAYETWDTYQVSVGGQSDYALTAQGAKDAAWQKQSRDLVLSGWFDRTTDRALLALTKRTDASTSAGDTSSQQNVDLELALLDGSMYWQGNYDVQPADDTSLPATWTAFTARDAQQPPALRDIPLTRFLMQESDEPLVPDYARWLDAADSISGPRPFTLSRTESGDLYTIIFPLSAAPEMLEGRFTEVVAGANQIADPDLLIDTLIENATVTWGVVIDSQSGRLLAQFTQLDLTTNLNQDGLQDPYSTLSLAYSDELNVLFSGVNEPVDDTALDEIDE